VAGPRFVLSKLADVVALVVETGGQSESVLLRYSTTTVAPIFTRL
jgi:hypothetical protein